MHDNDDVLVFFVPKRAIRGSQSPSPDADSIASGQGLHSAVLYAVWYSYTESMNVL